MDDKLLAIFIAEAQELISDLEQALLQLEANPQDSAGIATVFRAMHTLKGSAGMFQFESISSITHYLENIYQNIRDGKRSMDDGVLATTFKTVDHLRNLLDDPQREKADVNSYHEGLLKEIIALDNSGSSQQSSARRSNLSGASAAEQTWYISFLPQEDILRNGTNTLYLVDDLLALGEGMVFPFFRSMPELKEIAPDASYTGFEVVVCSTRSEADIREVFLFVEEECELVIRKMADGNVIKGNAGQVSDVKEYDVSGPKGFDVISSWFVRRVDVKQISKEVRRASSHNGQASIRVNAERLDELMNLVSELVTTQARLSLFTGAMASKELTAISEDVEKITRRLRDNALQMSLVPVDSLVVRFQRLVRDLSKEMGKNIVFKAIGAETEIDKSIIDKLTDPLLHLLRNSIDHGIEMPQDRVKAGKPAHGTVLLKASYSGSNVVIEIKDDGAGINVEKVKKSAINKGLIPADAQLSEKELTHLIFLPGFSTAEKVTDVSGRGVGMDVVSRNINDLRGEIDVQTTLGKGTTFTITLPLTLSILDGLLVGIGDTDFILPLSSVAKCYEVSTDHLETVHNQWITLDGKRTPFLFLRKDFAIEEERPPLSQVINVSHDGNHVGLVVDRIDGEYQAVLKPLGRFYHTQEEFSGATILGNGAVALVLDPQKLIRKLTHQHKLEFDESTN